MNEESHNIDEPVANSNLYQNNYNQYNTNVVSNDYNTVVNPVPVEPDYNESSIDNNSNSDGSILSNNMNSLNDSDNLSNNSDINNNKVIDDTVKNNLTFM